MRAFRQRMQVAPAFADRSRKRPTARQKRQPLADSDRFAESTYSAQRIDAERHAAPVTPGQQRYAIAGAATREIFVRLTLRTKDDSIPPARAYWRT
jgi:hypothetical protein